MRPRWCPSPYARYWHGYLIWLRPLLLVTTITGVRIVQYAVLLALLAAVLWLLRRRCGLRACLWFAVSQLLVTVFWVPHQVRSILPALLLATRAVSGAGKAPPQRCPLPALLVLGAATAFCDLLVTPILTLGLPLVCWLLEPQQRLRAGLPQCGVVVGGSLCWVWGICSAGPPSGCWRGLSPGRMSLPMRCIRWGAHRRRYMARDGINME